MVTASRLDPSELPDYSRLRAEANWDYTLQNYIESRGSLELAVAFAKLYWPDLVEYRDCILRADGFSADLFETWWQRTDGNRTEIECVLNMLHVREVVPSDTALLPDSVIRYLGRTIAEMWHTKAQLLFPGRRVIARFEDTAEEDTNSEPTVLLFQQR
ncbi:MAG: hypothetical protein ACREOJ_06725 [Gemmatimonadaceae bacterium]